jgi:hypothetical protein
VPAALLGCACRVYSAAPAPPSSSGRWHFLYFLPLPQWQGSLRPSRGPARAADGVEAAFADAGDSPWVSIVRCVRRWGVAGRVEPLRAPPVLPPEAPPAAEAAAAAGAVGAAAC